jgi:hypothetical protein
VPVGDARLPESPPLGTLIRVRERLGQNRWF